MMIFLLWACVLLILLHTQKKAAEGSREQGRKKDRRGRRKNREKKIIVVKKLPVNKNLKDNQSMYLFPLIHLRLSHKPVVAKIMCQALRAHHVVQQYLPIKI